MTAAPEAPSSQPEKKKKKSDGVSAGTSDELAKNLQEGDEEESSKSKKPASKPDAESPEPPKPASKPQQKPPGKITVSAIPAGNPSAVKPSPTLTPTAPASSAKKAAPATTTTKKPFRKRIFSKKAKKADASPKKPWPITKLRNKGKEKLKKGAEKRNKPRIGLPAALGTIPGRVADRTKGRDTSPNILKNISRGAFFLVRAPARTAQRGLNVVGDTFRGVLTPKSRKRPRKVNRKDKYKRSSAVWNTFWGKPVEKTEK